MPETSYYSGPALSVTSAAVTYKRATAPVSAIASVSAQPVSRAKIWWYIQGIGIGVGAAGSAVLLHFWFRFMDAFGGTAPSILSWLPTLLVPLGVAMAGLAAAGLVQSAMSRDVVIGLLSGSALIVRVPRRDADEIKRAVERAVIARAVSAGSTVSAADELGKLAALRDSGVLTPQDWDRAKGMYLGKNPDSRGAALSHLRGLHKLYTEGVLSLSEFNTKKWEVLTKRE